MGNTRTIGQIPEGNIVITPDVKFAAFVAGRTTNVTQQIQQMQEQLTQTQQALDRAVEALEDIVSLAHDCSVKEVQIAKAALASIKLGRE